MLLSSCLVGSALGTVLGITAPAMAQDSQRKDKTPSDTNANASEIVVTGRAAPVAKGADDRYQPTPDASTLRSTAPMLEVPQAVNIVSAQILRDQRPRYLDDALANVSGITQGNTLAGTQDTIMKRGFGGNRDGSIMHNGMPLVQGRGFNAAAQSVEVLKGPSSLLYGIMDPGGVINIVSKKPELSAHTSVSVAGSTYAHARNGYDLTLDTTAPIGSTGLAYRLVVDHIDEDYWRNFGKHRETLIAPSLAYYGENTKVVVWYEYRDYLTPFDRGTALAPSTKKPLDIPKTRRLDEPFNNMWGKTHLAQTSIDQQLGNGWAAHVSLSFNQETYDANQLRVTGVNTTTGTLTRSDDATHGALSTDYYGTAYIDGHTDLLGMRHDLQIGVEAESRKIYRKDLLRQKTTSTFSYLDPVYGQEEPSSTVSASDSDQTDKLHNYSVFAQDSIHVTDKLIAIAGGRVLNWNQIAGRGRPFSTNTDTGDTVFLPRAGLVYKWSPVFSLYASYSQSLKPASTIAPLTSGVVLDSGFAPERARSWEAGAKIDIPGRISGTLALYDINKRNVLVSQYNTTTNLTDYRTAGAARARGVELDLAGQVTSRLSAIGSFAYLDGKITQDPDYAGNKLWNAAQFTGSLSAVYDAGTVLGQDKLRFGGGPHYVGRRAGDSANSFFLPSYITADAFATYETRLAHRKVTFQFNVKNIFDKLYYPSSVNAYFVSVGDARQFSLRATVDL